MSKLTILLARAQFGEGGAREALVAAAYPTLRHLADERLRERGRISFDHSAELRQLYFSRLVGAGELRIKDQPAFFTYVPQIMRLVIADIARAHIAQRRMNAGETITPAKNEARGAEQKLECIVRVREALETLAGAEPRLAQIVDMGYCAGYSEKEVADKLGIPERTVAREWTRAQPLLKVILAQLNYV